MTADACPLVTVVVTARDAEAHVEQAITSVVDQTYRNIEILVVEHGSSDRTLSSAQRCAERDRRVRVVTTVAPLTVERARSLGVAEAKGSVIAFQDVWGWSAPFRVERQLRGLLWSDNTRGAVSAALAFDGVGADRRPAWRGWLPRRCPESIMMHRSDLLAVAPIRSGIPATSNELFEKVVARYGRRTIAFVTDPLYCAHVLPGRESAQTGNGVTRRPAQRVPIVAGMATFGARRNMLTEVIESIVAQVDELHIHLNDYEELPPGARQFDNVFVSTFHEHGNLVDNGKFLLVAALREPSFVLTIDDDIAYPPDYVDRMMMCVEQLGRKAVIGVHGAVLASPFESFYSNRRVAHFSHGLEHRHFVDLVGTGTMAMHSSTVSMAMNEFETTGMADLWFAIACRRAGVPRVVIDRPVGWLRPLDRRQDLYSAARDNDAVHTRVARRHGPWGADAAAAESAAWMSEHLGESSTAGHVRLSALGFARKTSPVFS